MHAVRSLEIAITLQIVLGARQGQNYTLTSITSRRGYCRALATGTKVLSHGQNSSSGLVVFSCPRRLFSNKNGHIDKMTEIAEMTANIVSCAREKQPTKKALDAFFAGSGSFIFASLRSSDVEYLFK